VQQTGERGKKRRIMEECRACPIPATAQTTGFPVWCAAAGWLQRNGKRKWCTGDSIQWTPAAARNATGHIRTHPHTSDHCRRQSVGVGDEGEKAVSRDRTVPGPLAAEECIAIRFCGTNEDTEGSSEGKAHAHHESVSCCVCPTDHGLVTRMGANKSETLSPLPTDFVEGRGGFLSFVRIDLPR
jgi:hypothetical protein